MFFPKNSEKFREYVQIAKAIAGHGDFEKAKSALITLTQSNCCDLGLCGHDTPDLELMRELGYAPKKKVAAR